MDESNKKKLKLVIFFNPNLDLIPNLTIIFIP